MILTQRSIISAFSCATRARKRLESTGDVPPVSAQTARFAYLFLDPLRTAMERAGAVNFGGFAAGDVPLQKGL
jgi:hypothetical protein